MYIFCPRTSDPFIDPQTAEQMRIRVPSSVEADISKHHAADATLHTDKLRRSGPGSGPCFKIFTYMNSRIFRFMEGFYMQNFQITEKSSELYN